MAEDHEVNHMISLKVYVDEKKKKKKRVIYAECDEHFVDFLFSFLTISLGYLVLLARGNRSVSMSSTRIGCMFNLYHSVENLDAEHIHNDACKAMLLSPRNARGRRTLQAPEAKNLQLPMNREMNLRASVEHGGSCFMQGKGSFMILDDLQVNAASSSAI
ncbi:hypothetical protein TIFTF001_001448 [Ficus carica]|uniref:Uncharacterized protein n=1 Tax=Ficus carica TaxID=3494 RepID=A0AA87YYY7_FICCA|nr:hypothetical protein TIFTF001_001448 [Ficus carica]